MHVGFQRRFDAGYRRAREAVRSGELGFVHTIRANTHDQSPPPAAYIPTSGGLFRDCCIHDFDIIRFVTGLEVATVFATGANKGDEFFAEGGDVDTAAALLTLDDDTLVSVTATRYNGGGHDVRMEVMGSARHDRGGLRRLARAPVGRVGRRLPRRDPRSGPTWSASCPPTAPSWPPSPRWWPAPRAPAPSRRPRGLPRRGGVRAVPVEGPLVDLAEIRIAPPHRGPA